MQVRAPAEPVGFAAILLAAGESTRMGRPKPLLPWLGTTLVAYQVEQLVRAGAGPVIVVLGHESELVAEALRDYPEAVPVPNPCYSQGKTSSIRVGAKALAGRTGSILLHAVDQPRRWQTLKLLIYAHSCGDYLITVPSYQGRRGHPPLLSCSLLPELESLSEETQGLRALVRRHSHETQTVPMETPECLLNANTPEDYREALAYFEALAP